MKDELALLQQHNQNNSALNNSDLNIQSKPILETSIGNELGAIDMKGKETGDSNNQQNQSATNGGSFMDFSLGNSLQEFGQYLQQQ